MDATVFKDYLEKRYYDQTNYYDKASGRNQKKYRQFQWTLIVLSALTPVLAALDGVGGVKLQFVVVIISALVAILTTGLKTFQYQELYTNYRSTNELLKPEIYYYNFNVGPYSEAGIDKETLFVSRVESILDKEHKSWPASKKAEEEKQNDKSENDKSNTSSPETNS